jgi:hypothetical protein
MVHDLKNKLIESIDGDDESEFEFLGQSNQKPLDSDSFIHNFTQNKYLAWNKLYYPFSSFSSVPFETVDPNEVRYVQSFSDELNNLNYSIHLNDDINNLNLDTSVNGSIYFAEFSSLKNFSFGGGDGTYFKHYLGGNFKNEQFTIVILTFKREYILMKNLEVYLKVPYLHSIIVVWNYVDGEPSYEFKIKFSLYISSKRLHIIKSRKNSLTNRFLPFDLIKTDAILSLDDDTQLRPDEIVFSFRVWRENRDRIVGFPARYHSWNYKLNKYEKIHY